MKNKLRNLFLLFVLGYGAIFGVPMTPKDVQELLDGMNQVKGVNTIQEHDDNGDPEHPGQ